MEPSRAPPACAIRVLTARPIGGQQRGEQSEECGRESGMAASRRGKLAAWPSGAAGRMRGVSHERNECAVQNFSQAGSLPAGAPSTQREARLQLGRRAVLARHLVRESEEAHQRGRPPLDRGRGCAGSEIRRLGAAAGQGAPLPRTGPRFGRFQAHRAGCRAPAFRPAITHSRQREGSRRPGRIAQYAMRPAPPIPYPSVAMSMTKRYFTSLATIRS